MDDEEAWKVGSHGAAKRPTSKVLKVFKWVPSGWEADWHGNFWQSGSLGADGAR